jgi:hypothetical protein
MREEWKSNAPEDEQGTPLEYPGNPEEAVRLRAAAGREWGTWELTRQEGRYVGRGVRVAPEEIALPQGAVLVREP